MTAQLKSRKAPNRAEFFRTDCTLKVPAFTGVLFFLYPDEWEKNKSEPIYLTDGYDKENSLLPRISAPASGVQSNVSARESFTRDGVEEHEVLEVGDLPPLPALGHVGGFEKLPWGGEGDAP